MNRAHAIEQRRRAIFQAAGDLIRETGSTDFSMPVLAKRAGLSNATTYNIIGTKGTVLYHLLDSTVEDLLTLARQHASSELCVRQAFAAADDAIDYFTKDPEFYRPLMQHLLGLAEVETRPSFMSKALAYWNISLGQTLGGSDQDHPGGKDIATIIHTLFTGAINAWIYGDMEPAEMRSTVKGGIRLILLGLGASEIPHSASPAE